MTETPVRRPPAPSPAERAKTIASRDCPGALMPTGGSGGERVVPHLHHVHAGGSVSLLMPDDHPLVERAAEAEVAVMFELTDCAPVNLREPVRGLLWITGWLRPLGAAAARARAVSISKTRADPRLLDLGHGMALLRLTPASLVLADAEGTQSLRPFMFSAAAADPFHAQERSWLRHLDSEHADVIEQLSRHVPEDLRGGRIRPLGLDRFGLRLRVEAESGDHDVRLAFAKPVHNPPQLAAELRRMMGCPFLRSA